MNEKKESFTINILLTGFHMAIVWTIVKYKVCEESKLPVVPCRNGFLWVHKPKPVETETNGGGREQMRFEGSRESRAQPEQHACHTRTPRQPTASA